MALRDGDAAVVEEELERILLDCVAPVDLVNENSYHMLVMGLLLVFRATPTRSRTGEGVWATTMFG